MNVAHLVRWTARRFGERTAFVDGERRVTFAELDEQTSRIARGLAELGIGKGDRVALVLENGLDFPLSSLAITRCGGVVVPLLVRSTVAELAECLRTAEAAAVFVSPSARAHVDAACAGLERTPAIVEAGSVAGASAEPLDVGLTGDDLFTIRFTGGTTGLPKGVMSSHRNYVALYTNLVLNLPLTGEDVALHVHPLSHAAGQLMYGYLAAGATQVIHPAFGLDPAEVLRSIERHRITSLFIIPTVLDGLVRSEAFAATDTSSLRSIIYGGAPMALEHLRSGQRAFGDVFVQIYGTSEAPQVATTLRREEHAFTGDEPPARLRSAGREALNVEVRVVDDAGRPRAAGEVGEVAIRGDNTMVGYWRNPELTAERVRDGWVHTGDMAYLDDEGYLYIVDRKDDMIITGGFNVWPSEVEAALYGHPAVQEAAVFGVQDARWGEAVTAAVHPRAGAELDEAEVIAFLTGVLSKYKVPKRVFIRDTPIPKSAVGKPMRRRTREEHVGLGGTNCAG